MTMYVKKQLSDISMLHTFSFSPNFIKSLLFRYFSLKRSKGKANINFIYPPLPILYFDRI